MSPRLPTAFNSCFEGRNGRRGDRRVPPPRLPKAFNLLSKEGTDGRKRGDRRVPEAFQSF